MNQVMPFLAGVYVAFLLGALVHFRRWRRPLPFSRLLPVNPLASGATSGGLFQPAPSGVLMNRFSRIVPRIAAGAAAGVATLSQAATDLTPITEAKTDALAVAAALLGVSVAVWAALFVKRKFFG